MTSWAGWRSYPWRAPLFIVSADGAGLRTTGVHGNAVPCPMGRGYFLASSLVPGLRMILFLAGLFAATGAFLQVDSTASSRALARVLRQVDEHRTSDGMAALQRGKAVTRLPDITRTAWVREADFWRGVQRSLRPVRDAELSTEERLTLRILQWEAGLQAERASHYWVDFSTITPYASPVREVEQLLSLLPLRTAEDRDRFLALHDQVAPWIDSIRAGVRAREARGIRLTRDEIAPAVARWRDYLKATAASPFRPVERRLASVEEGARRALLARVDDTYSTRIRPAVETLIASLEGDYTRRAPVRVGIGQYPGGVAYHRWLVRWHTTMNVTPEAVHRIGLREVARINREMAEVRARLGFAGTKQEFHAQLARDPRFFAKTPEEFGERLMSYARRLEPRLPEFFGNLPRARGDVRRLDPALEPSMTFGYYQVPTPLDSMGHYMYNGSSLSERTLLTAGPLIAHELWPGHHFQFNLAKENLALPETRRVGYYTAYGEGWGDYAAWLAGEMGLYEDPYDRYGRLAMEMFIACRLVVDTGMNALGWPRERAMQFMRDNALESETQIRSETLRYSADLPGQALAYMMGSLEFRRLRAHAQSASGSRFDIRQFHDMLLGSGSLPMGVLAERVEWWLKEQR